MNAVLELVCENMHLTEAPLLGAERTEDGSIEGHAGPGGANCSECGIAQLTVLCVTEIISR